MASQRDKQQFQKDLDSKDDEMEQMRADQQRKVEHFSSITFFNVHFHNRLSLNGSYFLTLVTHEIFITLIVYYNAVFK